jgi:hypothetical protein
VPGHANARQEYGDLRHQIREGLEQKSPAEWVVGRSDLSVFCHETRAIRPDGE